jgi:ketosteroid isomerase-like protein
MARNKVIDASLSVAAAAALSASAAQLAAAPDERAAEASKVAEQYATGLAALMRGDGKTYYESIGGLTEDFVLMAPVGGPPTMSADYPPERFEQMGRFFRNGAFEQRVLATYATDDMIVLATIEGGEVEVGGLPKQPWQLRVTTVFVRQGEGWKMAHRHADPLVSGISLERSAELARGAP